MTEVAGTGLAQIQTGGFKKKPDIDTGRHPVIAFFLRFKRRADRPQSGMVSSLVLEVQ